MLAFYFWAFGRTAFWAASPDASTPASRWRTLRRWCLRKWSLGVLSSLVVVASLDFAGQAGREFVVAARPLVASYSVLLVSLFVFSSVECFLHYQRVREIVVVLETTYQAFGSTPEARSLLVDMGRGEQRFDAFRAELLASPPSLPCAPATAPAEADPD
jgi:hypothetical protein